MRRIYSWPVMTAVFCLLMVATVLGSPDEPREFIRMVGLAMGGTALIYIPIMGREDRGIAPHRWMLFTALWVFIAAGMAQILEHFHEPQFEWFRTPLLLVGCVLVMVYIFLRYRDDAV